MKDLKISLFQKLILALMFVLTSSGISAQYSIGGGLSAFGGFDTEFTRIGINGFYEVPRNEVNTFYIRGTLTIPLNVIDTINVEGNPNNPPTPFVKQVELKRRTTMFSVDGGTRIYLYNTYDAGFAVYGGFHLKGILASYSERLGDYDTDLYTPQQGTFPKSTSLLMSIGGNLGFKYQLPMNGSITADVTVDVIRRLHDPASILGQEIAPLSFSLNLGYRFDWF